MKKKLFTLMLAVAASVGTMFAEKVQIGDLYYNLDATNQTAEVTSQNSSYPYWSTTITTANIPSSITYNSVSYSVTSIGDYAFCDCNRLTSVTIPNSVTSIGSSAFWGCSGLTSPLYNAHVFAYMPTSYSGAYTIPDGIESIAGGAFQNCSGLTSVTIPNSVTSIGSSAFWGCSGLTSPLYNAHVFAYMPTSYSGAYTIPDGIESIAGGAFYNCNGLTSLTIPNSVTSIGGFAFYHCSGLTSVTIPNSVTSIGGWAFSGCSGLTSATIPNSVTSIGEWAFAYCTGLTSVTIPNSVTSIDWSAFSDCSGLTSLSVEAGNTVYDSRNNCNAIIETSTNTLIFGCQNTTIPNSVTSIGDYAFYNCSGLTSVTIPNSVTSIGNSAFSGCSGLTSVTIPNSVTSIGGNAFGGCIGLTSVTIPNSVTSIGRVAFSGCSGLTTVTIEAETPPALGSSVFKNTNDCPIYVPCGTLDAYTSAWPEYANRIISMPLNYQITGNVNIEGAGSVQLPQYTCDGTVIIAVSNYGYHFTKWSDGNTDNPRTIVLTQDTTFTAEFAKNTYTISTTSANPEWGTTAGDTAALYLDEVEISAIPNYGYHFDHWEIEKYTEYSEYINVKPYVVKFSVPETWSNPYAWIWETGNQGHWEMLSYENGMYVYRTEDDNRNIILVPNGASWANGQTNDLAITESCCYTIIGGSGDSNNYYTSNTYIANKTYDCLTPSEVQIIIPRIDTVVSHSFENPLAFIVTVNQKVIAHFAKNVYSITANAEHGSISGNSSAEYLDFVTLTVTPDYGYHFTQWSDGLKDNPRIAQITQDTTFTAEFAPDRVGTCGKDLALVWSYDPTNKVLTIGNAGSFTENMQFGAEAPAEMEELVIGNSVTAIGANAFADISSLKKVTIGESVKTIGAQAFYNCVNLETIFNYRPTPTNAYSNAFDGVDKFECELYVLTGSINMYKAAAVWRDFYYTYAIGAEGTTVTTNDVTVEPQDNAVTLTWPTNNNAATYTIEITKDSIVFCTLIFNANGQLTGIAFALDREGTYHAPAAIMTANGLQFTVTGLSSNTLYSYNLTTKDAANQALATYSGDFTTTGGGVTTEIDNTSSLLYDGTEGTRKIIRNGQIYILRGDKTYTPTGQEVK